MRVGYAQLIKTKLEPPRLKDHILFRPKLNKKLMRMSEVPLTLVQSGPGFGKSTAVASYLSQQSMAYCWYGVTEQDDHLYPFLQYVLEAFNRSFPQFAEGWRANLLPRLQVTQEQDIYEVCTQLINECFGINENCLLILDDFHLVEHCSEIVTFMKWFILHLPEHIHVVLISRNRPNWELFHKLKVKGNMLEIKEQDFVFQEDEIGVLFEDYYQLVLDELQIKRIFESTEGWIMAIHMIWQQLRENHSLEQIVTNRVTTMEELFQYLATEVLNKQAKDLQFFLRESAIFDSFSIAACEQVLGCQNAARLIKSLQEQNLFLFSVGEQEFRYHALFREFLLQQLRLDPVRYKQLHLLAGEYYAELFQIEQAFMHYQQIDEVEKSALLIHTAGHVLLKQSHLESFLTLMERLPVLHKDQYPLIWVYQGDAYRYRSKYEHALHCYQRAEELFQIRGDRLSQSYSIEGAARIYLDTIQPKHAEQLINKAITLLEGGSQYSEAVLEQQYKDRLILLYSLMAENALNSGQSKLAETWYEKSRALQKLAQLDDLEARIHLRTGRLLYTQRLLEQRKLKEEVENQEHLPRAHRETELLLALVYAFLGEAEKAKECAERGIFQGVKHKSPFVEACGWIRMGHAVQLHADYDVKLVLECYQTALAMMEEIKVSRGKAEAYMGLCLLYGRRKNLALALRYADLGLAETEKVHDVWLSTVIRLSRVIALACAQKHIQALQELSSVQAAYQRCGDSYGYTFTLLWQAYLYYQTQDEGAFERSVELLIKHIELGQLELIFQRKTLLGPADTHSFSPMLLGAYQRRVHHPFLDQLIMDMGMEHLESHPGYTLRIYTLGEFQVYLGEQLVQEKDWKRDKAKELLQVLLTKRNQLISKEDIFATLYRQYEAGAAERDFKVALNTLNNVLEPQRKARATPFYIQRHGNAYGLNLAAGLYFDAAEFERRVVKGLQSNSIEQSLSALQYALELYKGDYLVDRLYADWCIEERERLQVLFLRGAERLAQIYTENKQYQLAIKWCERIIDVDKCWEEAYRLLMYAYAQIGNRTLAVKWYYRCQETLSQELGIEPMRSTDELFEMVMRGDWKDETG